MTATAEADPMVPGNHLIVPMPVVPWTTVVRADNPAREPTRGRLRELRKKGHLADGITVTRQADRGLQGRANYYSVLSALAARSRQEGHDDDASELERSASALESRFAQRLQSFLARRSLSDLAEAEFCAELVTETADRLAAWPRLPQELLASAAVADIDEEVVHLQGYTPRGLPVEVDLPRGLVERHGLALGDVVWVFSRLLGDAALVELFPAIRVRIPDWSASPDDGSFRVFADVIWAEGEDFMTGNDGLTDAERAAYAEQYARGAAVPMTSDQMAELKAAAAAGQIPRKRIASSSAGA